MFYMKMLATCVTDAQMSEDMVRETVSIFWISKPSWYCYWT